MDEQFCPRCKTTKYRNPSLVLMVNACGHTLCENCVDNLFVRGTGACPECGTAIRRSNFRVQLFEDATIEKEIYTRKSILKIYNRKEEDFASLREYNDYLEEVETIVFNLSNEIEIEDTKRRVELYKKENQEVIKKNRSKLSKDEEMLDELIEVEKLEHDFYRQKAIQEEATAKKEKKKNKDSLIDELMFSDLPASHIVAVHKKELEAKEEAEKAAVPKERKTMFSSGIRIGKSQGAFIPVPKKVEGEIYVYSPIHREMYGPDAPSCDGMQTQGYLDHIRSASGAETGGGYIASYACQRALQEAFCGLFMSSDNLGVQPTSSSGSPFVAEMQVS